MTALRLWADFNEIYEDNHIWTSIRPSLRRTPSVGFMLDRLVKGEYVELYDGEGCSCFALVESVDGPIIHCKLDWSTWREVSVAMDDAPETDGTFAVRSGFAEVTSRPEVRFAHS